jgi:hypothetical protein
MEHLPLVFKLIDTGILKHSLREVLELGIQIGILQSVCYFLCESGKSDEECYYLSDEQILNWINLQFDVDKIT